MARLALASAVALTTAEAGTLKLTYSDCGSTHGKVTNMSPTSFATGKTVTITGTGTLDEDVTAVAVTATISALGTQLCKVSGDGKSDLVCKLPLGAATITVPALPLPIAKGTLSLPVLVTTSASIPPSLANVDIHLTANDQNGESAVCLDAHTAASVSSGDDRAKNGKVAVEIMVETYCPCSGAWEAAWERDIAPKIGEIAELSRFFDAKKNGTQGCCNPSADAGATCMHKQSECVADSLQRCVQEHYPTNWLDFTNCISGPCGDDRPAISGCTYQFDIGTDKNLEREQACAQNLSMSWSTINECWQGEEGVQLMQGEADKSDSIELKYGISGLPVVWIDGQVFSTFMKCPTDSAALIQAICAASDATPLPDACNPTYVV